MSLSIPKAYPLTISPRQRLDDVTRLLARIGGGGTDCAQPVRWAIEHRVAVDAFVILTDSQTWYGNQHPLQAVQAYRRELGIPAKLVVVAMAANSHTIGDPADAGALNVVGFDVVTPKLVADFVEKRMRVAPLGGVGLRPPSAERNASS